MYFLLVVQQSLHLTVSPLRNCDRNIEIGKGFPLCLQCLDGQNRCPLGASMLIFETYLSACALSYFFCFSLHVKHILKFRVDPYLLLFSNSDAFCGAPLKTQLFLLQTVPPLIYFFLFSFRSRYVVSPIKKCRLKTTRKGMDAPKYSTAYRSAKSIGLFEAFSNAGDLAFVLFVVSVCGWAWKGVEERNVWPFNTDAVKSALDASSSTTYASVVLLFAAIVVVMFRLRDVVMDSMTTPIQQEMEKRTVSDPKKRTLT